MNINPLSPSDVKISFDLEASVEYINNSLRDPWGWKKVSEGVCKKVEFPSSLDEKLLSNIKKSFSTLGWKVDIKSDNTLVFVK